MRPKRVGRFGVASLCVLASCLSGRRHRSTSEILRRGGVLFTAEGGSCRAWDVIPIGSEGGRIVERAPEDEPGSESYDYYFTRDGLFVVDGPHVTPRVEEVELEELPTEGGYWTSQPERPSAGARSWSASSCAAGGRGT